jgi:hypothetical protein
MFSISRTGVILMVQGAFANRLNPSFASNYEPWASLINVSKTHAVGGGYVGTHLISYVQVLPFLHPNAGMVLQICCKFYNQLVHKIKYFFASSELTNSPSNLVKP